MKRKEKGKKSKSRKGPCLSGPELQPQLKPCSWTMKAGRRKERNKDELELELEREAIDAGIIEAVTCWLGRSCTILNSPRRQSLVSCACMHCRSSELSLYCRMWFRDTIRGDLFDVTFFQRLVCTDSSNRSSTLTLLAIGLLQKGWIPLLRPVTVQASNSVLNSSEQPSPTA